MFPTTDAINQKTELWQGNSSLVPPELAQIIQQSIQPIMLEKYREGRTFLAIGAQHGDRLMFQINVQATELPALLRSKSVKKEGNNPNHGKNRPINTQHIINIKNYLKERSLTENKWILGPITANVDPLIIKYQKIWQELYIIFIPNNTFLDVTDGQHRKRAIEELLAFGDDEGQLIAKATFPVNLVLEGDIRQCQIDFRDMAQTLPIPDALLVAYGGYGKDAIAKKVVEQVNIFRGKTQKLKASPGSKTGYIYTINYIAKLVGCAFAGSPDDDLSTINTDELVQKRAKELSDCLNYFFLTYAQTSEDPQKNDNWRKVAKITDQILEQEKLHWELATVFRDNCILGLSVGLEILGYLLHFTLDLKTDSFDRYKIEQIAKEIDWSRNGVSWQNTIVFSEGKGRGKISSSRSSITETLNQQCLKQLGWSVSLPVIT